MPEFDLDFTLLLISSGLMIGLMYALIALGFVLVYKATDAINFAQGEFVMFAAIIAAAAMGAALPFWLAATIALVGMIAFCFALERVVLRKLLGRPVVAVIMATIGLASLIRGVATLVFGAGVRSIELPVGDEPLFLGPIMLPPVQLVGAGVSLVFLAGFTWFFLKTRMGVAMRAVADNQTVSMGMGINVQRYFALAWALTGVVSALGGVIWGAMLGVDNQLPLVGLKVFPVVILGGLDSIVGAVVGGLIVGVVEALAAGYLDPVVGGGTKDFAPYVLMILMLMIRPYGSVRPPAHRARVMFYREAGVFKTSYAADMALMPLPNTRWAAVAFAVLFIGITPAVADEYTLSILNLILIAVVGAIGLNILVGYTDQVSIGHGAFMSVGAYTAAHLITQAACAVLDCGAGRWADGGGDRHGGGNSLTAHQGPVSGDRHACRTAHHRMDDQPRALGVRRHAVNHPGRTALGVRHAADQRLADVSVPDVLRHSGDGRHAEPDPQPHRPRLHRYPRPGHRRRDHRHQHLPLQAVGVRDLFVLRRRHRRAVHLLSRHRELRAVPARRLDQLPGDGDHRRAWLDAWARCSARSSSRCCRSSRAACLNPRAACSSAPPICPRLSPVSARDLRRADHLLSGRGAGGPEPAVAQHPELLPGVAILVLTGGNKGEPRCDI